MTVGCRAGAGITFRPEKIHDQDKALPPAARNPVEARVDRLSLPGMSRCFRSREKWLQNLFKKIDYLPHRTEIQRG
ncbi:MAG: hypothetical protein OP8BY_0782 [Candidatus Saccharicenans subterraneus]|uniref:Uncharacterized protein n=1 Tax=Candidatus Saccharicenans subterraneus TaxID=2508984 RepID=A0A3E2BPY9_9BACT|nr:MAG: hypothetical protein OP8BY_0782 [Candidatus Saccharicenans subterraneum]